MMRTAVLYARVSTDDQATSGYSLRQQSEALRAWCEREGYEVLEEVSDPGHSGTYLERPGLDRVRDLVAAGGVSVVLAQDADRITRVAAHRLLLDEETESHGARWVALDDWGDDSHEGKMLKFMKGWVSEGERLKIAERTRRGLNQKVAEGKILRRPRPPYGFRYDEQGEALVVSEPEMGVVRSIFRWVAKEGASLGEVQRRLKGEAILSPTGGKWNRQTIRYLILADLYQPLSVEEVAASALVSPEVVRTLEDDRAYGLWTWNKKKVTRWRERDETGEYRKRVKNEARPREQWSAVPVDLSEAGLQRELVDAARQQLEQNVRRLPSTRLHRFWLLSGGIARCAVCGNGFSTHTTGYHEGKVRTYYRCYTRYNSGLDACTNGRSVRAWELEEEVWRAVRTILSHPDLVMDQYDKYVERRKAQLRGDPDREARKIAERLEKLEAERKGYLRQNARGVLPDTELDVMLAEVDEQREATRKVLREARDRQKTIQDLRQNREILFGRFSAMRGIDLRNVAPETRRRVLQGLRISVEIDENRDARISGVFDTDITELLPMAQAPEGAPYVVHFEREIPDSYEGVVTLTSAGPCTS